MKMREILFVAMVLFIGNVSYSAQIVYPKNQNVTINADKTFFVGNEQADKVLKINGEIVNLHHSGGFKYVVKLNPGLNTFIIDNGSEQKTYMITRPQPFICVNGTSAKPIIYDNPVVISLSKDNIPLRSTPVDAGLNRLQNLPKGLEFEAIGEERGFYKVKLGRDGFGFISKDSAVKTDKYKTDYANVRYVTHQHRENEKFLKLMLDRKVPYSVTDIATGLDISVYNVDNYMFQKYDDFIEGKPFGYSSYYNSDGALIVSMKEFPKVNHQKPLNDIKITIDAGHGGSESGAIGCLGTKEKDVNLQISQNLKNKLENLGAKVFMTRDDDSYVGLNERVEKSNHFHADIFLSIHNNSLSDSLADRDASGTETYYFNPQSKELAKILAKSISDSTGFKNGGQRGQSFAVIRNTQSIAVLIEVGYMINPDDNSKIIDEDFQSKVTDGIIDGLERYLRQDDI